MHAAEIAAAVDPENVDRTAGLLLARLKLLKYQVDRNQLSDAASATAREMVAEADSLARTHGEDMQFLSILGMTKFKLAQVLQAHEEVGWQEATRSAVIDLEMASEKDKGDKNSLLLAGEARELLAEALVNDAPEESRQELRKALKDYREAERRDPQNETVKGRIRGLAELGLK